MKLNKFEFVAVGEGVEEAGFEFGEGAVVGGEDCKATGFDG